MVPRMIEITGQADSSEPAPSPHKPAPGDLALVQSFINTVDLRPLKDQLRHPAALKGWFAARGLLGKNERLNQSDLRHAIEVREALRDLLSISADGKPSQAALQILNRAARGAQLLVQFNNDGSAALAPATSGVDGALGRLLAVTARAVLDGSWQRLKACEDPMCRWAYYDSSRNRSGNWCDMTTCGNRVKARRYRNRRQA